METILPYSVWKKEGGEGGGQGYSYGQFIRFRWMRV